MGSVYAANTLGAILGALGVSLVLIPAVGTQVLPAHPAAGRRGRRPGGAAARDAQRSVEGRRGRTGGVRGGRRLAGRGTPARSRRLDRLRAPHGHQRRTVRSPVHRRGPQFVGGHHPVGRRHRNRRQRPRGSHHRAVRHEVAAHGGAPARDAASQPEIGSGHRLRRRRFGRHLHPLPRHREHHHLRNRARDPAHLHALLRPPELRGLPQSQDPRHLRRCAPLPDDYQVEVRHHRQRPARCVRQRHRRALFAGVLRSRAGAISIRAVSSRCTCRSTRATSAP